MANPMLVIHDRYYPLHPSHLKELFRLKLVYECGCTHGPNVHLDPAHDWDVDDVQTIIDAVAKGRAKGP